MRFLRRRSTLLALVLLSISRATVADEGKAAALARQAREAGLDPEECYRVRELSIVKEDLRLFLTEGYLIFGKPAGGRRFAAVFTADVEGGDAEILLFPPNRSERASLASATGSPNLNEHFRFAVFVFSDDTHEILGRQLAQGPPRKSQERGVLLAGEWNPVLRNLVSSFEIRLVNDLLRRQPFSGFFYAALVGKRLGNIDVVYDPRSQEQIRIGRVTTRAEHSYFEVWTSFPSRPFRTGQRSPAPAAFVLSNFRLDATVRADLALSVVTRVTVTPKEAGHRAIDFDLSRRMRVMEAFLDGQPVEVFQRESMRANLIRGRDDDVFLVVAPADLEPGRSYEVEIRHAGAVILDAGNRVYFVGARDNWYPNRYSQFAEYDATFRYPPDLDLVAAGEVVEQKSEGEWRVTRRRTGAPVRFLGFNLGDYHTVQLSLDGRTIEVCANRAVEPALRPRAKRVVIVPRMPGRRSSDDGQPRAVSLPDPSSPDPAVRLETLASEISSAFEFMASHFGPPPLRRLTVSPIPGGFGQGFAGLVYLSTISYLDPRERPPAVRQEFEQLFFSEILHAHETAHQWWGNVVTSASYRDDWVMEALSNYCALLHLERRKGSRALDLVLDEYKRNLLRPVKEGRTVESMGPIVWGLRLEAAEAPAAWQTITYEKGSWIMHMLRRRMGDERFLKMLGALRRRYEFKPVTTEQFRALAAEFLPVGAVDPALENFFEHWVYSTGIPTLELRWTASGKAPEIKLTGALTQSGPRDDISVDVPVEIQAGGKTITRWLRTSSEPAPFTIMLRQRPQKVVLDPANSVLAVKK